MRKTTKNTMTVATDEVAVSIDREEFNNDIVKQRISQVIKNFYDIQKLRIACGNRIVASFNIQMGQAPSTKQDDMDDASRKLINELRDEYKRITDAYIENQISIKKQIKAMDTELQYIKSSLDYDLVSEYEQLLQTEEQTTKTLNSLVKQHPLYEAFFKDVAGCGPAMAAVCIAYFDPYRARHVSCFWSYAGLNPVLVEDKDGNLVHKANGKCYTVDREYTSKDGETKTKKSITYNPTLKSKLLGVLGDCILKACIRKNKETGQITAKGPYANAYMDFKVRQLQKGIKPAIAHRRAIRQMIKLFTKDLWVTWRTLEGLHVTIPYEQEFLGRAPHKYPNLDVYDPSKFAQTEE